MLSLKPTIRANRRYLLIKGSKKEIEESILEYIGVLGWAEAGPVFVKNEGDSVVLAVNREAITNVRAAFSLSREKLQVLRVSGTLKGLSK